jgi:membrane protein DedA with SNARE-associated domain
VTPRKTDIAASRTGEVERRSAMVWVLLLVLAAIVLGIVGAVAKGLLYLLVIGVVVFVLALLLSAVRVRRSGRRPVR